MNPAAGAWLTETGRIFVLLAAALAVGDAIYLLDAPLYQPAGRGYFTLTGTSTPFARALLSRRHRRVLSVAAALALLAWSLATSYFGGLVWLPAVATLAVAALPRTPSDRVPARRVRR